MPPALSNVSNNDESFVGKLQNSHSLLEAT